MAAKNTRGRWILLSYASKIFWTHQIVFQKTNVLSIGTINDTNYCKPSLRRVDGHHRNGLLGEATQKLYTTTFFNCVQGGLCARSQLPSPASMKTNFFRAIDHWLEGAGYRSESQLQSASKVSTPVRSEELVVWNIFKKIQTLAETRWPIPPSSDQSSISELCETASTCSQRVTRSNSSLNKCLKYTWDLL